MADDMHATGTRAAKTIWCPECGALPPHHANTCSHRPADAIPNSSTEASFSSGDPSERKTPEPLGADAIPNHVQTTGGGLKPGHGTIGTGHGMADATRNSAAETVWATVYWNGRPVNVKVLRSEVEAAYAELPPKWEL